MVFPVGLGEFDHGGQELAARRWGRAPAQIVMLHDGLGSLTQWREVPGRVAARTGATVVAYDRAGHGTSRPVPTGPWPADWLHRQAQVLDRVLAHPAVGEAPLVVGHSDGGSIALIQAIDGRERVGAVLALAAHSWVEPVCVESISAMRANRNRLVASLDRFHDHPSELFEAWSGVWVSEEFAHWDIRDRLGAIVVPVIVAQGRDDAYATDAHATETAAAIGANARPELLADLGHILHHDDPDRVVALVEAAFALLPG